MKPKYNFWNQKAPGLRGKKHYRLIELIRDDVKLNGTTFYCPKWNDKKSPCRVCKKLFPRIKKEFLSHLKGTVCPCQSSYTRTHLIRVLNMVLRQNKHLKKERKTPPCPE